ncbi:MAG TPA: hypothetical protein VNY36_09765, partial [Bacteroidia bacterium]|nr:hypothetical protein [Bacteroidia bacterium]
APSEAIETSMRISRWIALSPGGIIVTSIVGSLLGVLLLGLIPAGLLAKPKPFLEEDNNQIQS